MPERVEVQVGQMWRSKREPHRTVRVEQVLGGSRVRVSRKSYGREPTQRHGDMSVTTLRKDYQLEVGDAG